MKRETFFEKFDQFADAPDAVAKMRELVLQLAVRGKLVSQNAADEPADALLASIRNTKHLLTNGKAIKKQAPVPVSDEEIPFPVPRSWAWTRLGEIGDWGSGSTPSRGDHSLFGGGITWLKSGELNDDQELERSEETLSDLALRTGSFRRNQAGDVLLAMYGATLGKAAILAGPAVTNQAVCGCTPFDGVCNRYLFNFLISQRANFCAASEGGAQPNISKVKIIRTPFPLPPLAEQKRIIAKVDELMALCDRLEAQQKERETRHTALSHAAIARFDEAPTSANLNFLFYPSYPVTPADLRKTILNLAAEGRLVPQNPADDPAAALLAQVNADRERRANEEGVRLPKNIPSLSPTDYPHDIPESWQWERIGKIALRIDYGTSQRADDDPSNVPVYRMGNIAGGRLSDENLKYVSASIDDLPALYLQPDDILFNRTNSYELVGKTAIFKGPQNAATFASYLIRVRLPDSLLFPAFFNVMMNAPYFRQTQIEPEITQQCGQANFNGTKLSLTAVPVPPLSEQRRIVARVNQLMGLVDQLEMQLAASEKTAEELLDAVVHELLHPPDDVIEFPRSESDCASQRAAIGCYAIEHLKRNPSFGHTMNMKVVYMAQAHIGLSLDLKFERQAAGPWHPWIEEFDAIGEREGWFTVTQKSIGDGHTKYEYAPKAALKRKVAEAAAVLGEHRAEFDRLLSFFADTKTVDAEIVATLFAAWNDFLIDGKSPTDDEIIREVRENWHQSKERFTPALLQRWLDWIRRQRLIPRGHGPRTRQQLTFRLNEF